jgi:prolyl oligopeptidase
MPKLMEPPPHSPIEVVTDFLHGVPVADPYRWLEDQDSPRTRAWIAEQTRYARSYLDAIPERELIRRRIRELLDVETCDSLLKNGSRYFFRKRLPHQEQPCIYMREGADSEDQLLINPLERATGPFTAVNPLRVSPDGRLLLYEVKQGGERTGTFELLEIETRSRLPDFLSRGYLRGFAFASDGKSFYYVHEALDAKRSFYRAAYQHALGTPFDKDEEIFVAGEGQNIRLTLFSDSNSLLFIVYRFMENTIKDIYVKSVEGSEPPLVFLDIDYILSPTLVNGKIFAVTDRDAPNRRIVEIRLSPCHQPKWIDVVPESEATITHWTVIADRMFVTYEREMSRRILIFDLTGRQVDEVPMRPDETVRILGGAQENDEAFLESESFTEPTCIVRYSSKDRARTPWSKRNSPIDSVSYGHLQVSYPSKDGTMVPMVLVGRHEILEGHNNPTIMTAYGGYGASMTPKFSVFVAFLMERGCLFALPHIRGGSEFGAEWHNSAKRRNRQNAYDDYLRAAEWLIQQGRTSPEKLAIFGGSNSGLLVGAALTQRPDLFRAVVCIAPLLDMFRYHLFDNAHVWKDEFGTADDREDFAALANYSPYHRVSKGIAYPATMIVSGDADRNCNPLHARKMTARLQAANVSRNPIFLDYSKFRGHSPVLPLTERIEALTDRMTFLCDQLRLPA